MSNPGPLKDTLPKIWIVNWDGAGKTELIAGYGLYLWKDPVTQKVWLYFGNNYLWGTGHNGSEPSFGVKRCRLDALSNIEAVWNSAASIDWRFRISRDGLYAAAATDWPIISFLDLQGRTATKFTEGCNQQIAPDNSYRVFNFESGNHAEIAMWGPRGAGPKTMINVSFAGPGQEAWAPRFSTSKAEIMTVNSPIASGMGNTDIFIAKFNADYTGIAKYLKVSTPNGKQKTSAMAWIAEGPAIGLSSKDTVIPASPGTTPAAVRIAISNVSQTGTLPTLSAASDQSWLATTIGGAGNSQYLDLQAGNFSALASGLYPATVTVTGQDVAPVTCRVTLRVSGTPVAASLVISPSSPEVQPGLTFQFTARVVDQFAEPMGVAVAWSVSSGGTISSGGLFTSNGTEGTFQVTATLASPALSDTATLVVADIPKANLALWLKADTGLTLNADGGVTNWKDWSDSGRDALTTSTTFPQYVASAGNGMPAVNFTGDQKLTFPQLKMTNFTVCAVYRLEAITKEFHFWLADTVQGLTAGGTISGLTGWGAWEGVDGAWIWRMADKTPLDWGQVTITNDKLYRNGAQPSYQSTGTLTGLAVSMLGSRADRDVHGFVGDIAEVLVYNGTLTAAERAKVEGYLRTRYNISGTVSAKPRLNFAAQAPAAYRLAMTGAALQLTFPQAAERTVSLYGLQGVLLGQVTTAGASVSLSLRPPAGLYVLKVSEKRRSPLTQKILID